MSIYFNNRLPGDPLYQNEDYRKQQKEFIHVLRSRTNNFSLKVGDIELTDSEGKLVDTAYLNIDLRDVKKVTVSMPNTGFKTCIHELFEILNENPEAECHQVGSQCAVKNLSEILGACQDILTVKFEEEWKRS